MIRRARPKIQVWQRTTVLVVLACFRLAHAAQAQPNSWVSMSAAPGQLTLTWSNADSTVDGFLIERSIDATNFSQIARVSPSPTSYQDNGVAPMTTYYYRVRAYNAAGFSAYCPVASNTSASSGTNSPAAAFSGYWDNGVNWSLAVPPSTADSSEFITNSTSTTVTADSFTAAFSPNALTISNLTLSAPAGSTNTLFLNGMNDWGVAKPVEILNALTIDSGALLVITDSTLQVDGLLGGALSVDGTVTMLNGQIVTTNASFIVGNQSVGSFTMYGGTSAARDVTVAANIGAGGLLSIAGGALTATSLTVINTAGSIVLSSGSLSSAGAIFNNGSPFVDGDGSHVATYRLLGGLHTFVNGLRVRNNAVLSGCGTIVGGVVVDPGGTVLADCGGTLTFMGSVTNNGAIQAVNGSVLESYAPLINNGVLDFITGNTSFHSTLINSGVLLAPGGTNDSWINSTGSKWETAANWSLGVAPFNQLSAFITNANAKTVTIDATSTNTPGTMAISFLTLSAPNGSTNTLLLNNAGTVTPLLVLSNFIADVNAAVMVNNSALLVPDCPSLTCTAFIIGNSGGGNQMTIAAGGQVQTGNGQVGYGSSSSNNIVSVTDNGSTWNNDFNLSVGYSGNGNSLVITNGGLVNGSECYVGYAASSSNNTVLVSGNGSLWNGVSDINIGYGGSGNSLVIGSNGVVQDLQSSIGYGASSSSNTVLVTDDGSVWNSYSNLNVGYYGSGNSLVISNGAYVNVPDTFIGYGASSSNNTVLVTGSGSLWNVFFGIAVGYYGSGNNLVINNGGNMYQASGFVCVGCYSSSSNNTVLVTDNNSLWSIDNLLVGCDQSNYGNSVIITNNGSVIVSESFLIGTTNALIGSASMSNRVSISGSGSLLVGGALGITASNSLSFSSGFLTTAGTTVTNGQTFVVGDGLGAATFTLLGGVHSFANGLEIHNNGSLIGCGTINGDVVVDLGGTVLANCGGTLTFTGVVINWGTIQVTNGGVLATYGTLVNYGTINIADGSTSLHGAFINNGTVVGGSPSGSISPFQITSVSLQGNDVHLTWTTTGGSTNVVQATASLGSGSYATNFVDISAPIVVAGAGAATTNYVEVGGATNKPARYYRIRTASPGNEDSVGDGIPDWWRAQYFGAGGTNTNSVSCATCDADGTGQNNLFKYVAGLNPTNPASVFVLHIQNVPNQPTRKNLIYGPIANGSTYVVESTTDLVTGVWSPQPVSAPLTNGTQVTVTDPNATARFKFYRVDIFNIITNIVIQDSVGDGIADSWRTQYFPSVPSNTTNGQSCATCDADGTGQNNLFKYVAGLDPTNPASVFVLTIAGTPSQPTHESLFFVPLALGRTYSPLFSTDLVSAVWMPLTGYTGPVTNGNKVTITDTNAVGPRKFYRFDISSP